MHAERERVAAARRRVADAEERVRISARRASAALDRIAWRQATVQSGDEPDR
jgi:hypothetical protein